MNALIGITFPLYVFRGKPLLKRSAAQPIFYRAIVVVGDDNDDDDDDEKYRCENNPQFV